MLDLQARVHLDEKYVLAVGDEFDGAGADIIDRGGRLARGSTYRLAPLGIKRRRRRLLDHLLMPPLQRAFAFEQRQQIAVTVADDLHLDMARVLDEFCEQPAVAPEGALALAFAAASARRKSARRMYNAHAA